MTFLNNNTWIGSHPTEEEWKLEPYTLVISANIIKPKIVLLRITFRTTLRVNLGKFKNWV